MMTLKITKAQERKIIPDVGYIRMDLDTIPEKILDDMKERVQDRMDIICNTKNDDDVEESSFLPHKSPVEDEITFFYWDWIDQSEVGSIIKKNGGVIDGGCQMKTEKNGERVKDNGRVTALVRTGSGEGIVDLDFRGRKKYPTISVAWMDDKQMLKGVPRKVFHDIVTEFGIDAPSHKQNCILLERERFKEDPKDYDVIPSWSSKCFGLGKET